MGLSLDLYIVRWNEWQLIFDVGAFLDSMEIQMLEKVIQAVDVETKLSALIVRCSIRRHLWGFHLCKSPGRGNLHKPTHEHIDQLTHIAVIDDSDFKEVCRSCEHEQLR